MKGKLLVIAFALFAVVAGALSLEPSATAASTGPKPSATPRTRIKAAPRKPPKRNGRANNFGDTPGLNGGDMMITKKTNAPTNRYSGSASDDNGMKRKTPKHPKRHH